MTLRLRLAFAFLGVVLVPLVLAAFLVERTVPGAARDQRGSRLEAEAASVVQRLGDLCDRGSTLARATALDAAARTPAAAAASAVAQGRASYAEVRDAQGRVLGRAGDVALRFTDDCAASDGSSAAVAGSSELRTTGASPRTFVAVVGFAVDRAMLSRLRSTDDVDLAVVSETGAVIASTDASASRLARGRSQTADAEATGGHLVVARSAQSRLPWVVVATSDDADQGPLLWVLVSALVVSAGVAWLLGRRLALLTTAPLGEVSRVAAQIADGDFSARVPVTGRDEVAELATAFNDMTARLEASFVELQTSRDQLRRDLRRLGETLSSTHDLTRILGVILDTAVEAVRAEAGAVYLISSGRDDLYLKVGRGLEGRGTTSTARLPLGTGAVGMVAVSGSPLRGAVGSEAHPAEEEPTATDLIAVALRSSGRVIGVLALYDRPSSPFTDADLETIRTFAEQASVAVDNVLLHQEAQRLSVTDGLTGLSNYRAFQRQLAREVERAVRFHRPLGLLLLDIDHFKNVNDSHGHQVGDAVLVELSQRVQAEVRDVDSVARYGGEELVIILPETDSDGAGLLAERICESVRRLPFDAGTTTLPVTVSIGVAALPAHGSTPADLLRAADEAMYAAKGAGRDAWRVAELPNGRAR
jgi:diguanylate cyclase (GGDEF)-like protein